MGRGRNDYRDPVPGTLGTMVARPRTIVRAIEAESLNKLAMKGNPAFSQVSYERRIECLRRVLLTGLPQRVSFRHGS